MVELLLLVVERSLMCWEHFDMCILMVHPFVLLLKHQTIQQNLLVHKKDTKTSERRKKKSTRVRCW